MGNAEQQGLETSGQRGMSIIAALFIIVVLAFLGLMLLSLVAGGSITAAGDVQSLQSFHIAEGGLRFAAMELFPNNAVPAPTDLGAGTFTVAVPTLTAAVNAGAAAISVSSTDGFEPTPAGDYRVMLCDDFGAGNATPNITAASNTCEKISFTGMALASFTGGARGADSTVATPHLSGAVALMYTWDPAVSTQFSGNVNQNDTVLCVNSIAGFTPSGIIRINDPSGGGRYEDVLYAGATSGAACAAGGCGANPCFTGCVRRAFTGTPSNANHNVNRFVYQAQISVLATSTGLIGSSFGGTVSRSVQAGFMPLQ